MGVKGKMIAYEYVITCYDVVIEKKNSSKLTYTYIFISTKFWISLKRNKF